MNIVDLVILGIICFFIVRSYQKGFTGEIFFNLVIIAIAFYVAFKLYPLANPYIRSLFASENLTDTVGFIAIFILVSVILNFLRKLLQKLLEKLHLNWLNKLLGAGIGFIKALLLVGVFLLGIKYLNIPKVDSQLKTSKVTPYVTSLFTDNLIPFFTRVYQKNNKYIPDKLKNKGKKLIKKFSNTKSVNY